MQRGQLNRRQRPTRSTESILAQRAGRPYCWKCKRFVKHRNAVWIGRSQCRCPVCGELLQRVTGTPNNE